MKEIFEAASSRPYDIVGSSMAKQSSVAKPTTPAEKASEKNLKKLFGNRDRTRPGSREEEPAAEKILEAVFPDTNAD